MERGMRKVVVVTMRTRLEELKIRYNTTEQAKFYIEHMGQAFDDYIAEDEKYREAVKAVSMAAEKDCRLQIIDRSFVPNMIFGVDDIVVCVGRDGLIANTMKYLDRQPLIGINPDPARWDGVLLPFEAEEAGDILQKVYAGAFNEKRITMAKAVCHDGQEMLAVNDLFIGCKSQISARYTIWDGERSEKQSSSGIIVSTGLGSTGWMKSVITQMCMMAKSFGIDGLSYTPVGWEEDRLRFVVREQFPSVATKADIVFGDITDQKGIRIVSDIQTGGVIFSDGMEADAIEFNSGNEVNIGIAENKGHLVTA